MPIDDKWKSVIAEGYDTRAVAEGIYSVLPDGPHTHLYDGRATLYDLIVGTRLYNRVMWGASLPDYVAFARQAIASDANGMMLDAGCGSLLFSARAYLDCERPILAFDQSLQMLKRARFRLKKLAGFVPDRFFFLQGDLNALPFRPASFHTALCMNVLHHLADAAGLITGLKKLLVDGGYLYLTSLLKGDRLIGDYYLKALYERGDLVRPRTGVELGNLMVTSFGQSATYRMSGNMAFATAATSRQQRVA